MEQTKLKGFKRITTFMVFAILLIVVACCWPGINQCCSANTVDTIQTETITDSLIEDTITCDTNIIRMEEINGELIAEVNKYIATKTKKHHQFIPKYIVNAGLSYDIDICFIMAQTQIETCYGTLGAGREISRRSLFGVAISKYASYEQAIDAYCRLLQKSYLGRGKTEQHLLTKYVTFRGARYAENPNYEKDLRTAYNHIKNNTNIWQLQQEYKNIID